MKVSKTQEWVLALSYSKITICFYRILLFNHRQNTEVLYCNFILTINFYCVYVNFNFCLQTMTQYKKYNKKQF